jgi:fructosamine-3-kinase
MTIAHRKTFPDRGEALAEIAGLRWLADAESDGGVRTARVLAEPVDADDGVSVALERVSEGTPGTAAAERFGQALAHTHAAGAVGWGTPPPDRPDGAAMRMGRGRTPFVLLSDAPSTWGAFFAEYRVLDYVRRIVDAGGMDTGDAAVFDRLADRLRDGIFDAPQPDLVGAGAARLHGDLWAGNVLWSSDPEAPTSAVLIDCTAHGGHAETDLALLALFGLTRLETVVAAYDETSPLADGWRDRVELHQVAPLLLHSLIFGGGYTDAAIRAASRYA